MNLFFENVVPELILYVAMMYQNDLLAQPHDNAYSRFHCYTAYRQYVLWMHVYLRADNRRVVCMVVSGRPPQFE